MDRSRKSLIFAILVIAAAGTAGYFLWIGKPEVASRSDFDASTAANPPGESQVAMPSEGAAVPGASPPDAETSERVARQMAVLDEVLKARNDNDSRLDSELKDLGPQARTKVLQRYERTPPERRNERGTLVFLIARDPRGEADERFLASVLDEPPCLSLGDCSKAPAKIDPHHSGTDEKTLAYPQLVVLYHAERELRSDDPIQRQRGERLARAALRSPIPAVADRARKILQEHDGS